MVYDEGIYPRVIGWIVQPLGHAYPVIYYRYDSWIATCVVVYYLPIYLQKYKYEFGMHASVEINQINTGTK